MAESEEELKSLLTKVEEESEKNWLKTQHSKNREKKPKDHGIQGHHFMQIDGETMETVTDFTFLGSKITADGDCSHEIKRCLFLRRKAMANLVSVLKIRDINLPTMVHLVKAMVFLVVMYGCDSWTLEIPLDRKEIKPVNPKGNQP